MHKRPVKTPHTLVRAVAAVEVTDVAAVLAVKAHRNPGGPSRRLNFQRGQVAAVHDVWPQAAKQLEEFEILPDPVAWRLVQRDKFNITALNTRAKVSHFRQRNHGVPIGVRSHMVDQVDDAVFKPADVKAVHDMDYVRPRVNRHIRMSWGNQVGAADALQPPQLVAGGDDGLGIKGRLDVDKRAAFDQFLAKVFQGQRSKFFVRHRSHNRIGAR